jgi:hypothetical protein
MKTLSICDSIKIKLNQPAQASPKQATTVNRSIPAFPEMILLPQRTQA